MTTNLESRMNGFLDLSGKESSLELDSVFYNWEKKAEEWHCPV